MIAAMVSKTRSCPASVVNKIRLAWLQQNVASQDDANPTIALTSRNRPKASVLVTAMAVVLIEFQGIHPATPIVTNGRMVTPCATVQATAVTCGRGRNHDAFATPYQVQHTSAAIASPIPAAYVNGSSAASNR
jgi:hypothetical protein